MTLPPNIILTGFMGSGKTSTGLELAKKIGFEFLDLDEIIEKKYGKSIEEIFRIEGEPFFRAKEWEEIQALEGRINSVICPGGGAWTDGLIREKLLMSGWCVWLQVSPEEAWRRIRSNLKSRPLIKLSNNPSNEVQKLLMERDPAYALAHQKVLTDGLTPIEVSEAILELLKRTCPFPVDFSVFKN